MIQTHEGVKIPMKRGYPSKRKSTSLNTDRGVDPRLEMMAIMSIIPAIFPLRVIKILNLVYKEERIMKDLWVMEMYETPSYSVGDSAYDHTCSQQEKEHG
jgi:hypothetical protein